jgi:hypothetical protein
LDFLLLFEGKTDDELPLVAAGRAGESLILRREMAGNIQKGPEQVARNVYDEELDTLGD